MIESLPLFHRIAGQTVLVVGDEAETEPKARLVERAGGIVSNDVQRAIDEGVRLAFVGYTDAAKAESMAIRLRCAGMLVNVVDKPDLCDFTTPSVLDRRPLLIAVGTGGASAGLAKHVRLRLEAILPGRLGELATKLSNVRARLRRKLPDGADRRRAIDAALQEGGPLDPLIHESADRVDEWLKDIRADPVSASAIHEFTIASDNPEDLTVRQARLLGWADTVYHDPAIGQPILDRARADARRQPRRACRRPSRGLFAVSYPVERWCQRRTSRTTATTTSTPVTTRP